MAQIEPAGTAVDTTEGTLPAGTGVLVLLGQDKAGKTLEQILTELVAHYQWQGLAERVDVRCFKSNPTIKSSLTFLRKTPWAREKVEQLYVKLQRKA